MTQQACRNRGGGGGGGEVLGGAATQIFAKFYFS